ncbi:unnamed protein product [Musa textilis]
MASPSGTSSGSSLLLPTSGSEEDLQAVMMDQKKRKRMMSNRESARRSRMRKQKHLDDLTAQANQLRKENSQILSSLALTTQQCFAVEADNSVLRTQTMELTHRLQSLNEILLFLHGSNTTVGNGFLIGPWSSMCTIQPIMASAADNLLQH